MSTTSSKSNKFSNKLRKNIVKASANPKTEQSEQDTRNKTEGQGKNDDFLTRMAIDEIVKETAKGAIRAEQMGPSGWLPCPLRKTNKRFLRNTIKSVISHNRNRTVKPKKSEEELDRIIKGGQRRKPKFGERKHCFRRPDVEKNENRAAKTK